MPPDRDAETRELMLDVLEKSIGELKAGAFAQVGAEHEALRAALATRIRTAVALGQRDPDRLKAVALQLLDGEVI